MPKKRYNAEEIIHKLREADVLLRQGATVSQVCKRIGVSAARWASPDQRFATNPNPERMNRPSAFGVRHENPLGLLVSRRRRGALYLDGRHVGWLLALVGPEGQCPRRLHLAPFAAPQRGYGEHF